MSNSIAEAFKKLSVVPESPSEHEQVFSVSYDYLTKVKNFNDLKAFKNCLVALINLDRYHKAYEIIKKIPQDDEYIYSLLLEISYVYYKVGKSDELVKLYHSVQVENEGLLIGFKHIVAQNFYKIGAYEESLKLYYELIEKSQYDNKVDLVINERAIVSQLNHYHKKNASSKFPIENYDENYDLYLNESLIEISNNNLNKAVELLEAAERNCLNQNASSSTEDLLSELLPIKLTLSYVYELLGDKQKSLDLLTEQDASLVSDVMLKLIIKNNYYAQNRDEVNWNYRDRDLDYQSALHKLGQKLTKFQYQILTRNSLLLRYLTGALSTSQINNKFIKEYLADFPGDFVLTVYKILLHLDITIDEFNKESEHKTISRKVLKYINNFKKHDDEYIIAVLLLVFLNQKKANFDQSLPILESLVQENLAETKLLPGLIGTLIQVYEKLTLNQKLDALLKQVLDKVLATDESIFKQDLNYYNFVKVIAFKALNHGEEESAIKTFKHLSNFGGNDKLVTAILNNSADNLSSVSELASSRSIEELLSTSIEELIPTVSKSIVKTKPKADKITKKRKAKFSPNKVLKPESELALDDERWLPMKLRSYYKPSKKEKKKTGGHQGAMESTPVPAAAPSTSSNSNKKKKKKGKK